MVNLDPRAWSDTELESTMSLPILTGSEPGSALGHLFTDIIREVARRADIRINRGAFGGSHDASWYEPRQIDPVDLQADHERGSHDPDVNATGPFVGCPDCQAEPRPLPVDQDGL